MRFLLLCLVLKLTTFQLSVGQVQIAVDWQKIVATSKTTPTLQVVTNDKLLRTSPIHDQVFNNLKYLNATYTRFAAWFPYPKLAVAELEPPTSDQTSWNFTLIDQMFDDFMDANKDRHPQINFCTIPQWMFKTPKKVPYPDDPAQADWSYSQGTELVDSSMKQLTDYYKRLIQWYTQGGFTDELGRYHKSGHRYTIDQFEFLNEIEAEHITTPDSYTKRYDAVVKAVQEVVPDMKFVALALGNPNVDGVQYVSYFLNASNHQPNVPLDYISYHFYAVSKPNETVSSMQYSFFEQADTFIETVKRIEAIRMKLSPNTKTNLDEVGTVYADAANQPVDKPIPKDYFELSGANYAYLFTQLVPMGIDILGMSQLVGFPSQYPSVTMLDWDSGEPNYRYRVLKTIINEFGPGDQIMQVSVTGDRAHDVSALAAKKADGRRKVLLVNKRRTPVDIQLDAGVESVLTINSVLIVSEIKSNEILILNGFDVVVLTF